MTDMNIAIIAFVFGLLLLLISILGGGFEIHGLKIPRVDSVPRIVATLLGLIFIISGIVMYYGLVLPPLPVEIKIIDPKEGDKVPIYATINGTISGNLPDNQYMWLVVNPHTSPGKWWPQGGRISPWKGQWNMGAQFGGEGDTGTKFDIAVVLLNEKDDQSYLDYIMKGQQTGILNSTFLPATANMMDKITITRI